MITVFERLVPSQQVSRKIVFYKMEYIHVHEKSTAYNRKRALVTQRD